MSFNRGLAERFELIARMIELTGGDSFRAAANAKASRVLGDYPGDLEPIARAPDAKKRLQEIDGVGPKIADKIIELATTGVMKELEELRAQVPAGLLEVMSIPGLGPKTVHTLWKQGGVTDMNGLKRIIADGSILTLPRMGEKSVEKIKASLALAETSGHRLHLGLAAPIAERVVARLRGLKAVKHAAYAGSARRGRDTVGDLDVLVAADDAGGIAEFFRSLPEVRHVLVAGETRTSVRIAVDQDAGRWTLEGTHGEAKDGPTIQVDLRIVPVASWGAALMYFTGSKEHNVRLRERAQKLGLTLNEYGLFPEDRHAEPPHKRGVRPVAGASEEEVFAALGFSWVPPEQREDRGELEHYALARSGKKGAAPSDEFVRVEDIVAELHSHTTASDGVLSVIELANAAKKRGFHTIAVTDHSKSSAIANGLSPERLRAHISAVRAARAHVHGITILTGSEVDILADGSLDYDDDLLAELDVVVASPHAGLSQEPAVATKRLLRAIEHPAVHILGHPTGRLINRRAGLSPDMGELIAAAIEHGVALEINAHWMRLDLRDVHARQAVDAGALIAIDCDVHEPSDFDNLRFGVQTARRGWVKRESCVNTWSAARLHQWLTRRRAGRPAGGGGGGGRR